METEIPDRAPQWMSYAIRLLQEGWGVPETAKEIGLSYCRIALAYLNLTACPRQSGYGSNTAIAAAVGPDPEKYGQKAAKPLIKCATAPSTLKGVGRKGTATPQPLA